MRLYLDASDLINILQRNTPCTADYLEENLRQGGHQLAVSLHTVSEMSAPLAKTNSKTNVMALLNRLGKMPIIFMRSDIDSLELGEALDAFSKNREYIEIHPFTERFDQTVDLHARPPTSIFINYSLAETVWDLHCQGVLEGLEGFAKEMRRLVSLDRHLKKPPTLKVNFVKMIERNLKLYSLPWTDVVLPDFADWIYENPSLCPAIRLGYEVWHKIIKNKTDPLEDSDMEDYQHLTCLPYVDFMTLDRRMHAYVSQASGSKRFNYRDRIFKSAQDLFCRL
jgi:hypothetical protein